MGLRLEDRMDGSKNFVPWKSRIMLILQENELWDEVVNHTTAHPIQVPIVIDAVALEKFNEKEIKVRRIILDVVKDHVIPQLTTNT